MTIAEQLKAVEAALQEWAQAVRGSVSVASDVVNCLDLLQTKPGVPRVAILFVDELPRGEESLGRVDRTYKCVVSRGRGLKIATGESWTDGVAGGPPMFDLVEQVRTIVLGMRLDVEEELLLPDDDQAEAEEGDDAPTNEETAVRGEDAIPTYKGTGDFEVNGLLLDAKEVRFSLAAQLIQQDQV